MQKPVSTTGFCNLARTCVSTVPNAWGELERVSSQTGATRSELIRRAVNSTFGPLSKEEKLRALRASAGALKHRKQTGAEYVDSIRTGNLNQRLARLGFDE